MTNPKQPESHNLISFSALSKHDRERYPTIIYALDTPSKPHLASVVATVQALRVQGMHFEPDLMDGNDNHKTLVIRSASGDKRDCKKEGALFLGIASAVRHAVESSLQGDDLNDKGKVLQTATSTASAFLDDFFTKKKSSEAFFKYYSGLRWNSDQESFIYNLFCEGVEYSEEIVATYLSADSLRCRLLSSIGYDEYKTLKDLTLNQLFEKFPQLDYKQLRDGEFAKSEKGKRLTSFYAQECGEILAQQYKYSRRSVDSQGNLIHRPLIPLSRHPIIEALICEELVADDPQSHSSFGPQKPTEIIIHSDSQRAHTALVNFLTRLLGREKISLFSSDERSEINERYGIVKDLTHAYRDAQRNPNGREAIKNDLIEVLRTFTHPEFSAALALDDTRVVRGQEIVRDIVQLGITSGDPDFAGYCEEILMKYLEGKPENTCAFGIDQEVIQMLLIDALFQIDEHSDSLLIQRLAALAFQSHQTGTIFKELAALGIESSQIRHRPEVLLAADRRAHSSMLLEDKEGDSARQDYDRIVAPATVLDKRFRTMRNAFLIQLLKDAVIRNGKQGDSEPQSKSAMKFDEIHRRIRFMDYFATSVPDTYFDLVQLAEDSYASDEQKKGIVCCLGENFNHVVPRAAYLLIPVLKDIYRIILGTPEAMKTPTYDLASGMHAAVSIVNKNSSMFKSLTQDDFELFEKYREALALKVQQLATNAVLPEKTGNTGADHDHIQDTMMALGTLTNCLNAIRKYYEEYQHFESVKVEPHVYYPWILQQMLPFFSALQWEVGPGNRPNRLQLQLYELITKFLSDKKFEEDAYPEGYDCIGEGGMDEILKNLYEIMVPNLDLQRSSSAVWQKGLPFLHSALSAMPEPLVGQIVEKHKDIPFAQYVLNIRESDRKHDEKYG
ncbi:MAG: hypothetical protein AAB400_01280 [Patescibacteria group bacterium]